MSVNRVLTQLVTSRIAASSIIHSEAKNVEFTINRDEGGFNIVSVDLGGDNYMAWVEYIPENCIISEDILDDVCNKLNCIGLLMKHEMGMKTLIINAKLGLYADKIDIDKKGDYIRFRGPMGHTVTKFRASSNKLEVKVTWGAFKYSDDFNLNPLTSIDRVVGQVKQAISKLTTT